MTTTRADDFGLVAFYPVALTTRPSCYNKVILLETFWEFSQSTVRRWKAHCDAAGGRSSDQVSQPRSDDRCYPKHFLSAETMRRPHRTGRHDVSTRLFMSTSASMSPDSSTRSLDQVSCNSPTRYRLHDSLPVDWQ
ncbi:unnamed protein product, partial [Protopolystoma xenopodis]